MGKTLKDLKFDEHNFNTHTPEGMELLKKSIQENGYGRSVLVDKNNNLIAGNGVAETAMKLGGAKTRFVEVQGDELVVVKRKDLDINTPEGRKMAYADNAVASANLKWNEEELARAKEEWGIVPEEWGKVQDADKAPKENYTRKIEIPTYEPKSQVPPKINELFDKSKTEDLQKEIESVRLPKEIKEFLLMATYRHVVFNYENIAEYYSHAPKKIQELFEKSALVIIDINDAIKNGYVKYCKDIIEQYKNEHDEEE